MAQHHSPSMDMATHTDFQDDVLSDINEGVVESLGRAPGHKLSDTQENLVQSVREAFDEGILNQLSQRQRECFTDVIISGDTYEDVAVRYHISKGTVQGYVKRAAVRIRKYIEVRDGI